MKKSLFVYLFFFAVSLFAQHGVPAFVESEMKQAAAMRQAPATTYAYDWIYERLNLNVDPRQSHIEGTADFYFKPLTATGSIKVDLLDNLNVSSVVYHRQNIGFTRSNDQIHVRFPVTLSAGALDSIQIRYSGDPATGGFGSFETDNHNGVPVLWTLSEPYGAADWWPCKNDLSDKLDSVDVILHYPAVINGENMQGVSNGMLISENADNGIKTSHWRHRHKIPAYLVAIAVTNYAEYTHQVGIYHPFPVENYVYPEDSAWAASRTPVIVDIMNFYEQKFGEYHFSDEKYGHAEFGWGGGMEHTTITFVGGFSRGLLAHELAHHWFGDNVTCGSWSDIWLNEGFATYSEALTQEHLDGQQAFLAWKRYAVNGIRHRPHQSVYVYGNDTLDINRVFSWYVSYLKGAMVLHMIRYMTGDQTFFQILHTYLSRFTESFARTEDFKQAVEDVTGRDWTEFFNDWIYGKGFPSYTLSRQLISGTTYRITIDQTQSDASVNFFEMLVKLRFIDQSGNQVFDTIVPDTVNHQTFVINPGFEIDSLIFDPEDDIIKGETVYLNQGKYDWKKNILVYPNPVRNGCWVFIKDPADIRQISLYDISGKFLRRVKPDDYLDMQNLSAGIYLLQIRYNNKQIFTQKLIKL